MKLYAQLSALFFLIVVSPSYAAIRAELKVSGTLLTPSCNISLQDGGLVDFGTISRGSLSATGTTAIGSRGMNVSVTCDVATAIAIQVSDNRATASQTGNMKFMFDMLSRGEVTLASDHIFSLGMSANNTAIGGFAVRVGGILVGGAKLPYVGLSAGQEGPWINQGEFALLSHQNSYMMASDSASMTYVNGSVFNFPLDVAASINMSSSIAAAEDVMLDGSITFEVLYL